MNSINWGMIAAVLAAITCFMTFSGIVFIGGQLRQVLREHSERLDDHGNRLDEHDAAINKHAEELAESRGFRDGFKAAKN